MKRVLDVGNRVSAQVVEVHRSLRDRGHLDGAPIQPELMPIESSHLQADEIGILERLRSGKSEPGRVVYQLGQRERGPRLRVRSQRRRGAHAKRARKPLAISRLSHCPPPLRTRGEFRTRGMHGLSAIRRYLLSTHLRRDPWRGQRWLDL